MSYCPICNTESALLVCPKCGFDNSSNYEKYPTLGYLSSSVNSVSFRHTVWQNKNKPYFYCPNCTNKTFLIDTLTGHFQCAQCGRLQNSKPLFSNGDQFNTITAEQQANIHLRPLIAAGGAHTVVVRKDGTAVAIGNNRYGQCNL